MIVQNGDAHLEAINKEFSKGLFDRGLAQTWKNTIWCWAAAGESLHHGNLMANQ
jgi:hypothetical protein